MEYRQKARSRRKNLEITRFWAIFNHFLLWPGRPSAVLCGGRGYSPLSPPSGPLASGYVPVNNTITSMTFKDQ